MGFKEVKKKVIGDLLAGDYVNEARADIDEKNLLQVKKVTVDEVVSILKMCRGNEYSSSPHHLDGATTVHVVVSGGMYIKFFFEPDSVFISVHYTGKVS